MDNAVIIISNKATYLRERLTKAQQNFKKIRGCTDEMNGNTSEAEEEEFIKTLNTQMPDVFKNIEFKF
jgi:hypothetical protein